MRAYPTGLIANDHRFCPKPPYAGKDWKITLKKRESPAAEELRAKNKGRLPRNTRHLVSIGDELIIHAADEQAARQAALLLHAAYCLIEGGMLAFLPGMSARRTAPSSVAELQ